MSAALPLLVGAGLIALGCSIAGRVLRSRRRRALNEALHELRRPLQRLALADGLAASPWAEPAARALADLDAAINGSREGRRRAERVGLGELIEGCRARWQPVAAVAFEIGSSAEPLAGDPQALGAALDNLIANALEHGSGPVRVHGVSAGGELRLAVESEGRAPANEASPIRRRSDPRRGHGLRVARRVAAAHGGRLEPVRPGEDATPSALVLPLRGRG